MSTVLSSQNNDPERLPLTPELIDTVSYAGGREVLSYRDLKQLKMKARHIRNGCLVLTIKDGKLQDVYQISQFTISPTE